MRKSDFACFKNYNTCAFSHIYSPILFFIVHAMLLLLILFSASPAYAEETKVFTDSDLENYNAKPMVDQETLARMEEDLNLHEKKRAAELLLEKEKMKRQQAEEVKKAALQKRDVKVSRVPVSRQSIVNYSGITNVSSPGMKVSRTTVSNRSSGNNSGTSYQGKKRA